MLIINVESMAISLTRGDEATIEFSAKENGNTYLAESGDELTFGVSKKYGGEKTLPNGFSITNKFDECFEECSPDETEFNADKTSYFTKDGNVYTRCTSASTWSSSTQYYENTMWNIFIEPEHTKTLKDGKVDTDKSLKFSDYVWDLQLNNYTIIGKSENLEPKFTVLGEVV